MKNFWLDKIKEKQCAERWSPLGDDECGWIPIRPTHSSSTITAESTTGEQFTIHASGDALCGCDPAFTVTLSDASLKVAEIITATTNYLTKDQPDILVDGSIISIKSEEIGNWAFDV
jgi:hypothetical protein